MRSEHGTMRAFTAGFLSTLVFHQGVLTVLWWSGTLPRAPYDMARPSEQGPAKGPITPLRLAFSKSALCLSYQPGPGAATPSMVSTRTASRATIPTGWPPTLADRPRRVLGPGG